MSSPPTSPSKQQPVNKPPRVCVVCGQPSTLLCSQCQVDSYCSAVCKNAAWSQHSQSCHPKSPASTSPPGSPSIPSVVDILRVLRAPDSNVAQIGAAMQLIKSLNSDQVGSLVRADVALAIIQATEPHVKPDQKTALLAVQAIMCLTSVCAARLWAQPLRLLFNQGCVQFVIKCSETHAAHLKMCEFACSSVVSFCPPPIELVVVLHNTTTAARFLVNSAITFAEQSKSIVLQSCVGLCYMASEISLTVSLFKRCSKLISLIFAKRTSDTDVMTALLALVRNLVADDANIKPVFDLCADSILAQMTSNSVELLENTFATLTNLALVPEHQAYFCEKGTGSLVLNAINKNKSNVQLVTSGIGILANLCYEEKHQKALFNLGAVQTCIDCCKAHPGTPSVLMMSAALLTNISAAHKNLKPMMDLGAGKILVNGLALRGMHTENCLNAIANFATDPSAREDLREYGALEKLQTIEPSEAWLAAKTSLEG